MEPSNYSILCPAEAPVRSECLLGGMLRAPRDSWLVPSQHMAPQPLRLGRLTPPRRDADPHEFHDDRAESHQNCDGDQGRHALERDQSRERRSSYEKADTCRDPGDSVEQPTGQVGLLDSNPDAVRERARAGQGRSDDPGAQRPSCRIHWCMSAAGWSSRTLEACDERLKEPVVDPADGLKSRLGHELDDA